MSDDYTPQEWSDGGIFEAADATEMSAQIDEEEEINVAQDAAIAGKQAGDADLTALAAVSAGDGYAKRASGVWAPVSAIPKADLHSTVQASLDKADTATQAADLFPVEKLTTGFCVPHRLIPASSIALVSGRIQLDYFTAPETANRNNIVQYAGSTAMSGTAPTMVKFGVYSVAGNGDLTLIAQTTNDTTLFAAAFGQASKAYTAPCPFVRGSLYAKATLIITTGTICTGWGLGGVGAGELATAPRWCGQVTGQTDLPASIAAASVVSPSSVFIWGRIA